MSTTFHYTRDTQRGTESLIVSGEVVRTVPSSHPNFIKIRNYCFEQQDNDAEIDMDYVLSLHDAERYIGDQLLRVTDRISFKNGNLLWDGEAVENALTRHIVRMIKDRDDNYVAFAKFMENLANNPSKSSRDALFEWIADRNWTITSDGEFVGYKGVRSDYRSKQQGYGIVTTPDGVTTEYKHDNLPNVPGNIIEVPRNRVDADRESACSFGLHVGTRSFAQSWASGGRMVLLAVNPRDVVMVPRDGGGEKMRVCRYKVLEENTEELTTTSYQGTHRADDDTEDGGFYDNLCVECDCILDGGKCPCEGCAVDLCEDCEEPENDCVCDDGVEKCSDCGDDITLGTGYCANCDCLDCGELKEDCICNQCSDCGSDPCECCQGCGGYVDDCSCEEDGVTDLLHNGVCSFCGGALNEAGFCPWDRSQRTQ